MLLSFYSFSPRASAAFEADSRELFRQVMESLLLASLFCNSFILGLKIPSLTEASHKRESLSVAFFPCFYRLYICIWWLCSCMYETDHFWAWEFIIYTIMQISIFFPRKRRRAASHRKSSTMEMKLMQIFFWPACQKPTPCWCSKLLLKIWKNYSFLHFEWETWDFQTIHFSCSCRGAFCCYFVAKPYFLELLAFCKL